MNSLKKLCMCFLVVGLMLGTSLAFAQEEEGDDFAFAWTQMRYRFDHEVNALDASGDMGEYFDDDFDTTFTFTKGDVQMFFNLEVADSNLGGDVDPQGSYSSALGDYGVVWTPESLVDNGFTLQLGEFNGMDFGKLINNDDGVHGNIVMSWKLGDIDLALGYAKRYEGNTTDDADGDNHLLRAKVGAPVGENFNVGAYTALYMGNDVLMREGSDELPEVKGSHNIVIGGVEFAGTLNSFDIYSELGFATGTDDALADDAQATTEIDLSGFYAMGGASVPVGQGTLGIEAGFGSGDDDPTDDKDEGFTAINSDFWLGEIMHDEELITRTNGAGGGLSNIIYAQITADMSPTDKLDLSTGFLYLKPVEEVGDAENYGMELYGSASYALADSVKYNFYWGVAIPDEDFVDESLYQFTNRLEFDIK